MNLRVVISDHHFYIVIRNDSNDVVVVLIAVDSILIAVQVVDVKCMA